MRGRRWAERHPLGGLCPRHMAPTAAWRVWDTRVTWLANPAHTLACGPQRTPCRPSQGHRQRAGKWVLPPLIPGPRHSFPAGQGLSWNRFSFAVTKSKCPSYVGVTGILLQETKHVFKIITKGDRLKGASCPLGAVGGGRRQPSPCGRRASGQHRLQGSAEATPAPGGAGAAPLAVSLWVQGA